MCRSASLPFPEEVLLETRSTDKTQLCPAAGKRAKAPTVAIAPTGVMELHSNSLRLPATWRLCILTVQTADDCSKLTLPHPLCRWPHGRLCGHPPCLMYCLQVPAATDTSCVICKTNCAQRCAGCSEEACADKDYRVGTSEQAPWGRMRRLDWRETALEYGLC